MSGKPQIPDSIKQERGTLRTHRKNNRAPKSEGTLPPNPFDDGTFAHIKWHEITSGLLSKGIVDKLDGAHLQGLCRAWQTAVESDRLIDELGILIATETGPKKNPAVTASKDAWAMVRQLANDLGLNHLSRQRLIAHPEDETPKRMRRDRAAESRIPEYDDDAGEQ